MIFRYYEGRQSVVDIERIYLGGTLFLLGGSPVLRDMELDLLERPGIVTMAINNVIRVFSRPNLWICADKPACFGDHVFTRPDIWKFVMVSRAEEMLPGLQIPVWRTPSTFFYGAVERPTHKFLDREVNFGWYRSTFTMALQVAWFLGFRRIVLVGCTFALSARGEHYAWDSKETTGRSVWSQATYDEELERLKDLRPLFDENGFELISATPGSRANEILPYQPLREAVATALGSIASLPSHEELVHSAELAGVIVVSSEDEA